MLHVLHALQILTSSICSYDISRMLICPISLLNFRSVFSRLDDASCDALGCLLAEALSEAAPQAAQVECVSRAMEASCPLE